MRHGMELESPSDRLQEVNKLRRMIDHDNHCDHNDAKLIGDLGNDDGMELSVPLIDWWRWRS